MASDDIKKLADALQALGYEIKSLNCGGDIELVLRRPFPSEKQAY